MTNRYLEKIASVLDKEAQRRVEMEPGDKWKHARNSELAATAGYGTTAAAGLTLGYKGDKMKHRTNKVLAGAAIGGVAAGLAADVHGYLKTRKALDKKYEVRRRK